MTANELGPAPISAAEAMAVNLRYWEEVVPVHAASRFYDVAGFLAGRSSLGPIEDSELGSVAGLNVLHLQCHFGMDSLELARRGAVVTGLDYAATAVAHARALSRNSGLAARFIECNVCDPAADAGSAYDLVFTSWGVLGWLPDLAAWARLIAHSLRPGGRFYIVEQHPAVHWFDDDADPAADLAVRYDHRGDGRPELYDEPGTYADRSAPVRNTQEYFWRHTMADVLGALLGAGLSLTWFREHDLIVWPALPQLVTDDCRVWRMPAGRPRIPLSFSLSAHKP